MRAPRSGLTRRLWLTGLVVLLALCLPSAALAAGPGSISGQVLDGLVGVEGVTVTAADGVNPAQSATTDSLGRYEIADLADGLYDVSATLIGWAFAESPASVSVAGVPATQDFTASPAGPTTISGVVTKTDGGGLAGVEVGVDASHKATTDASGVYTVSGLATGAYTVTPALDGWWFTPTNLYLGPVAGAVAGPSFSASPVLVAGHLTRAGGGDVVGARVELALASGDTLSTTTDASGRYSFVAVPNGNHTLTVSKAGYASWSPFGPQPVSVNSADRTVDFVGTPGAYGIAGTVKTAAGIAIPGVQLTLDGGASGPLVESTGADGAFSFTGLEGDRDYTLTPAKAGYAFTPESHSYSALAASQSSQDFVADGGLTISGTVSDAHGALSGATVSLGGDLQATVTTDGAGSYEFAAVGPGSYVVTPSKTGYGFTPPSIQLNDLVSSASGQDFSGALLVYKVSGYVKRSSASGPGIAGATVTLSGGPGATTTTDANGRYEFADLVPGDYAVAATKAGYSGFAPSSQSVSLIDADVSASDFVGTPASYSIDGKVEVSPGVGVADVQVRLTGGNAPVDVATDGSGAYVFTGVPGDADYTVTPSKAGYTFSPSSLPYSGLAENQVNQDFVASPVRVVGHVKRAGAGSEPIQGATATLNTVPPTTPTTATTNAAGEYEFSVVPSGSYTVTVAKAGYASWSPASRDVSVAAVDVSVDDFVGTPATYKVSGRVRTSGGAEIVGATVTLGGDASGSQLSGADGSFEFAALESGSYTLLATKAGYTFPTDPLEVSVSLADATGQDIVGAPAIYRAYLPLMIRPPVLADGDFESGLGGWAVDPESKLPVSLATGMYHSSPTHSLLLGSPDYPCSDSQRSVPVGFARATRQVAVPDVPGVKVSFWYRVVSRDQKLTNDGKLYLLDTFEFAVNGGEPLLRDGAATASKCGAANDLGWKRYEVSLDGYRGQTIRLEFATYSREPDSAPLGFYNTYAYLDDVTITTP